MASIFSLTSRTHEGRYMKVTCTQTKDVPNNRSKITWMLESTGGNGNVTIAPTTVTINGTEVYSCELTKDTSDVFPAKAGSVTGTLYVSHDTSGNKSITVTMDTNVYDWTPIHYSGSWALDQIIRQATLSYAPDFSDTSNPTITYSNKAGKSVTSLEACISLDGEDDSISYRAVSKVGTSYTFNLTDAELDLLRNATAGKSRTVYFLLKTVIGGSTFLDSLQKTLTIQETDAARPTVSIATQIVNGTLPTAFSAMYIQGKSKVKVTITAQGKYGATISSYSATVNGQKNTESEFTSDFLPNAGEVMILATATDSRGFTGTASAAITVEAYAKPQIVPVSGEGSALCYRCDTEGNKDDSGERLFLKALMSYTDLNGKNSCSMSYRYRESGATEWSEPEILQTTDDAYSGMLSGTFQKGKSYSVQASVTDTVGETSTITFDIPTEFVTFHMKSGGKGIGIGKYAEKEALEVNMPADFIYGLSIGGEKVPQMIMETGSADVDSGSWTDVISLELPCDGLWIINSAVAFPYVNTTGVRRIRLAKKEGTDYSVCGYSIDYRNPVNGYDTTCRSLVIDNLTAGTYVLQAEQNSGVSISTIPTSCACFLGKL